MRNVHIAALKKRGAEREGGDTEKGEHQGKCDFSVKLSIGSQFDFN